MLHRFINLFFILFIFLIAVPLAAQKTTRVISKTLVAGVTETIDVDFTPGNILVGEPTVCNFIALREQRQITLVPKKAGKTSLTIFDLNKFSRLKIDITVIVSDRAKIAKELQSLLGDIEGIKIKIIGKKVLVDGEILLPSDLNRIITVANQYAKEEVGIIATLSPVAQKIIADKMQEDIHKLGHKEVRVRAVNQRFLVEGSVARGPADDVSRNAVIVIETAKTYVPDIFISAPEKEGIIKKVEGGPAIVVNLLTIKPAPPAETEKLVRIAAHYVELSKNYAKNFAFNWTPGIKDTSGLELKNGALTTTVTGTVSNLLPKLNSAKSHGHARVLESSSIIVQDKEVGTIKNMQHVPVTVATIAGGTAREGTEYKDIGFKISVKPITLPDSNNMRLDIEFELSNIIGLSKSGAPLLSSNNLKTTVIVGSTESVALGGIVTNSMQTDYNKLPSNIKEDQNILFNLYRSKSFQNNKSQFIIFITPEILKSASEGSEELKRKFRVK